MSMEKNDYIVYEAKKWTRGGVDLSPLPPCHDFNQTLTRLVGEGTAVLRDEVLFARYGEKTWPATRHRCEFDARPFQSFDIGRKNARNPFFFSSLQRFAKFVPNGGILALEISYRISNRSPKDRERVVRTETKRVNDGRSAVACLHKFEFESIDRSIER